MRIVENKFIPFRGFSAVMLFGVIFTRDREKITPEKVRHEEIHFRQMLEIDIMCACVIAFFAIFSMLTWWWMLASAVAYYTVYALCWIMELILPPYNHAYGNICLESEAIYNMGDEDYLKHRPRFAFLKYISNSKYPYPR